MKVPFFRPSITVAEMEEVAGCLRSGWLTTGPLTRRFEEAFSRAVGGRHAVALNSCTAALHLAVEVLGLQPGEAVLVPTMTFAATAAIVRYRGAIPVLVDCDPDTGNMDLDDAAARLDELKQRERDGGKPVRVVGIIVVHVGGLMMDMAAVQAFARQHGLWVVEDAAHSFPAAWRASSTHPWQRCGEETASVTCYSFYANKTITTGEGGMAVTPDADLAARMRMLSLHGLSQDAWNRYGGGSWDYRIQTTGYKYNLTDIASALGLQQIQRAESLRLARQRLVRTYLDQLSDLEALELPPDPPDRIHSWHLFPIRLRLEELTVDRNTFLRQLNEAGVGTSVHWRPLHLHPYYKENFGLQPEDFPVASQEWLRLISLPLFPDMSAEEQEHVIGTVRSLCRSRSQESRVRRPIGHGAIPALPDSPQSEELAAQT